MKYVIIGIVMIVALSAAHFAAKGTEGLYEKQLLHIILAIVLANNWDIHFKK